MELRHFRYFFAVAEAGSLTVAAQQRLHKSQPSLSRQIRDLENEVGAQLVTRSARGIELTPAGRAFLDHARSVLVQVDAAAEAARRVAHPASRHEATNSNKQEIGGFMPTAVAVATMKAAQVTAADARRRARKVRSSGHFVPLRKCTRRSTTFTSPRMRTKRMPGS